MLLYRNGTNGRIQDTEDVVVYLFDFSHRRVRGTAVRQIQVARFARPGHVSELAPDGGPWSCVPEETEPDPGFLEALEASAALAALAPSWWLVRAAAASRCPAFLAHLERARRPAVVHHVRRFGGRAFAFHPASARILSAHELAADRESIAPEFQSARGVSETISAVLPQRASPLETQRLGTLAIDAASVRVEALVPRFPHRAAAAAADDVADVDTLEWLAGVDGLLSPACVEWAAARIRDHRRAA